METSSPTVILRTHAAFALESTLVLRPTVILRTHAASALESTLVLRPKDLRMR